MKSGAFRSSKLLQQTLHYSSMATFIPKDSQRMKERVVVFVKMALKTVVEGIIQMLWQVAEEGILGLLMLLAILCKKNKILLLK
jgi:hypothetical protein